MPANETLPPSWSATAPIEIDYAFVGAKDGWRPDIGTGLSRRDLGLSDASHGSLGAVHWRRVPRQVLAAEASRDVDRDFRLLYVLDGTVTVGTASGAQEKLPADAVALHGPAEGFEVVDASDDAEAIDIVAPAARRPSTWPTDAVAGGPIYLRDADGSFVVGAGPRRYFAYRDLRTTDLTGRRIHVHVVKALEPLPGGTGWHTHTMSQLFFVLDGWADIEVEGRGARRMHAGDAMCLRAGMKHNVPDYSDDYRVLEMCVPADYDTTATASPAV